MIFTSISHYYYLHLFYQLYHAYSSCRRRSPVNFAVGSMATGFISMTGAAFDVSFTIPCSRLAHDAY